MVGGGNGWDSLHYAYAGGLGNNWTAADGPWSMAYFAQEEIPTQFDIAQGWTVLDMNVQSVLAPTDPNRIWWNSGTINAPGSPSNRHGEGSVIINNNAEPGMFVVMLAGEGSVIVVAERVMTDLCRLRG